MGSESKLKKVGIGGKVRSEEIMEEVGPTRMFARVVAAAGS